MKARLEQVEVRPGQPAVNTARLLERMADARRDGVALLVFPEMVIPGYLLGDEWERPAFLRECEACGERIREASRGLTVVFGNVAMDWERRNEDGRVRKYNAAWVADDGRFRGPAGSPYPFAIKALLPNYREFDDSRYFHDLRKLAAERGEPVDRLLQPVETRVGRLGCAVCEDAWDADYALSPLATLARNGADVLLDISASPFTRDKNHKRNRVFGAHAARLGRPLLYVNHVGIQNNGKTVYTFEGGSCAYDGRGGSLEAGPPFEECALTVDLPADPAAAFGNPLAPRRDDVADLHRALRYGVRGFLRDTRISRVVVGVSGGIDSAVAAALYRECLDPADLLLVSMPGPFTSGTTSRLARELADRLGAPFAEVPITPAVDLTLKQLDGLQVSSTDGRITRRLSVTGAVHENIQARDRSARVLAGLAAACGGAFSCNANKSEATVGYTTLYGDLGGFLACLADLWKTDVYALAAHLNATSERPPIPSGSLSLPPSAELSAAHNVDEGKGDPLIYPYHDRLFASWVERWNRATPEDNLRWYAEGVLERELGLEHPVARWFPDPGAFVADLERWWNAYQGIGVAKRIQAPPVLAVTRRAFGFDHRESQMGPRYTEAYRQLKADLLGPAGG